MTPEERRIMAKVKDNYFTQAIAQEETKATVTVRSVDKQTWMEFRALCLQRGSNVGPMLTYLMKLEISK